MFCRKCGNMLPDNAKFCNACGAPVERPQEQTYTTYQNQSYNANPAPKSSVGFIEAVKLYFTRYAEFSGRSRRSEYWWAVLFTSLVSGLIAAIVPDAAGIWSLVTLIPGLAVLVRRLHDVGKSGWYCLMSLIPLVGGILVLIQLCKDSEPENQWGRNPKM